MAQAKTVKTKKKTQSQQYEQIMSYNLLLINYSSNNEVFGYFADALKKLKHKPGIEINDAVIYSVENNFETNDLFNKWQDEDLVKNSYMVDFANKHDLFERSKESDAEYTIVIDLATITESFDLQEFINKHRSQSNKNETIFKLVFDTKTAFNSLIDNSLFVLPRNMFSYFSENLFLKPKGLFYEIHYKAKRLKIKVQEIMSDKEPFINKPKRNVPLRLIICFVNWFFLLPVKEIKAQTHKQYDFIKESPVFRLLFASIALVMLIAMPVLSFDAGISGDEDTQYVHSKDVINYYKTFGKDTTALDHKAAMHFYGASFDILTAAINDLFNIEKEYASRHFLNAIFGWFLLIFTALIAYSLFGWRAALITLLLAFFSPRLIGHVWNNPKDIPFAMAYIMTIYFIILFIKELPRPSFRTSALLATGIALAISVRIGGVLLIAYFGFFVFVFYLFHGFYRKKYVSRFGKIVLTGILISAAGYFLGLLLWPYALQNPFKNPYLAYERMVHIRVGIRQVFGGEFIWSNKVPDNYIPTYLFYTIPIVLFVGFALYLFFINQRKNKGYLYSFILLFAFIFPIFWIIYNDSNLYGGIRHVLFAFPLLIVGAGIGFEQLLQKLKNPKLQIVAYVVIAALAFHPVRHFFVNHPFQYIYFNEIKGGVNKALGEYEMDYYYHSLKQGSEWLIDKIDKEYTDQDTIVVGTNHLSVTRYNFRHYGNIRCRYIRYYSRGNKNFDYAVVANSYISPHQQKRGTWPPTKTIHTVKVEDVPVCAVIERKNKDDLLAFKKMQEKNYPEAIKLYLKALEYDKNNETALLNLTQCYIYTNLLQEAIKTADRLLKVYPKYDKAMNWKGIAQMRMNQTDNALETFNRIIRLNYRFVNAYYFSGIIYANQGMLDAAVHRFVDGMAVRLNYDNLYTSMADLIASYYQKNDLQTVFRLIVNDLDDVQVNIDKEKDRQMKDAILYRIANALQQKGMENVAGQLLGYANSKNYLQSQQ